MKYKKSEETMLKDNNKQEWPVIIELHLNKLSFLEHNRDCNLFSIFLIKVTAVSLKYIFFFKKS